jgi:hypothetical protein
MYRYIIIKPDGSITCESHKKGFEYAEIRRIVDGLVQIIPYFSSFEYENTKHTRGTAYANEEGWLHNLPFNSTATSAWMKACPKGDPQRMQLMGNVVFVHKVKDGPSVKTS